MKRARVTKIVLALGLLLTSIGIGGYAGGARAEPAQTGNVTWPAGANRCENFTSADPATASTRMTISYPLIFASPAHNAAHPGVRQRVEVSGKIETYGIDGSRAKYLWVWAYSGLAGFGSSPFAPTPTPQVLSDLELGNIYTIVFYVDWYDASGTTVVASATVENQRVFDLFLDGTPITDRWSTPNCTPVVDPQLTLVVERGTVNQNVKVYSRYGFLEPADCISCNHGSRLLFDGIPAVVTELAETHSEDIFRFKVPVTTAGPHTVRIERFDGAAFNAIFTVKPRIKIVPGSGARGSTVNVSLRGYSRHEQVRVRWKQGARFVTLATVQTSNTGSANVDVAIPAWALDGLQTIRGDGARYRAETKVFQVSGGAFVAADEPVRAATPTPTSTPTATPAGTPDATADPATSPTAEATPETTQSPTAEPTSEATIDVTETATVEPTPESTMSPTMEPTAEPVIEPTQPVDIATPEATVVAG